MILKSYKQLFYSVFWITVVQYDLKVLFELVLYEKCQYALIGSCDFRDDGSTEYIHINEIFSLMRNVAEFVKVRMN